MSEEDKPSNNNTWKSLYNTWKSPSPRRTTRTQVTDSRKKLEERQRLRAKYTSNNPNYFSPSLNEDECELNGELYNRLTRNYPPEQREIIFGSPQAKTATANTSTITREDNNETAENSDSNSKNNYETAEEGDSNSESDNKTAEDSDSDTDSELDYDSDSDLDTMEDSTKSNKTLLDYIKARQPDQGVAFQGKPTLEDKLAFRLALIGALESLTCPYTDTGYSWLIEDSTKHKARTGVEPPIAPTYPGPEDPAAEKTAKKLWKWNTKCYHEYKEKLEDIHLTLEHRFPGCLTKYKDTNGRVKREWFFKPKALTDALVKNNNGSSAGHTTFTSTQEKMTNMRVTPLTAKGLNDYFLKLEQLMEIANAVPITAKLTADFLNRTALAGIMRSDFPKDKTTEYERQWLASTAAANKNKEKAWKALKEFYYERIELLELSPELSNRRANAKAAMNTANRIQEAVNAAVAEQEQRHAEETQKLQAHFTQELANFKAYLLTNQSGKPTDTVQTPSTTGSSISDLSAQTLANLVQQAVSQATATKQSSKQNKQRANSGAGTPPGKWKQWKNWCFTCGVNLTHDSPGCKKPQDKRKSGHDSHLTTSSYTNKLGGNSDRDHLWEKWFHPDLRKPCTTPVMPTN